MPIVPKMEINQESSDPTSNLTAWMTQSKLDYKELVRPNDNKQDCIHGQHIIFQYKNKTKKPPNS